MKRHAIILAAAMFVTQALTTRADAGGIEVHVGATVERTWKQIEADKYAYGPKQEFDAASGETHVYLPYGSNAGLYDEVHGALTDVKADSLAMFHSSTGDNNALLSYKLHFDRRIGTLRFKAGWIELGLHENTVAGVEYSEDGQASGRNAG